LFHYQNSGIEKLVQVLFCGPLYNSRSKFIRFFVFKLEEEGMPALLLHLLKVNAETADSGSAVGFCCRLVVATVQPSVDETVVF
jgi:hypothetical protein